MSRRPRRNHTSAFKAKVAIAAIAPSSVFSQLLASPRRLLLYLFCIQVPD